MNWTRFFLLMGAIYLAPHTPSWASMVTAAVMTVCALVAGRRGE